ncbi:MAG: glycosyltransferase family 2 protein [Actinomycetes bacterium]
MTMPSVSVVIATRDRPALLDATLNAILTQDYDGQIEVLVVYDQATPDGSIARAGGDRTVRVLTNERTPGLAGARNTGALAAVGDLLAFCDDDDTWLPDKLRLQAAAMHRTNSDVSLTGIYVHYGRRVTVRIPDIADLTPSGLIRDRVMAAHPSTYVVSRSAFLDPIGLVDEDIPGSYGEDWDWLLRAAQCTRLVVVPRPLIHVLWHPQGSFFSRRWLTIAAALDYMIDKHPAFKQDDRALARLYGQKAFAYAAAGEPSDARHWARAALQLSRRERRAYLALLVARGVLRAETVMRLANKTGRGI